jgi:hypothetical protein
VASDNHSIFFDKQGNARTAAEVYNLQTKGYAQTPVLGEGIKPDDPIGKLDEMLKQADTLAETRAPGDATYKDTLRARVQTEWNRVKAAHNDNIQEAYNTAVTAVLGDEKGAPKSLDEFLADPSNKAAYNQLDAPKKYAIRNQIANNARGNDPSLKSQWNSPQAINREFELKGMAQSASQEFLKQDITNENLSPGVKRQLMKMRMDITSPKAGAPVQNNAVSDVNYFRKRGIIPPDMTLEKDTENYNIFIGKYSQELAAEQEKNPKVKLTLDEKAAIAARMMRDIPDPSIIPFMSSTKPAYQSDQTLPWRVPPKVSGIIAQQWAEKFPGRRPPSILEQQAIYERNKEALDKAAQQ